ncbi:hypothetical protein ACFSNO_25010 [Streptomyces cirratus]
MADARDGAVNADDHGGYFLLGPLHCDNADYLAPATSRTIPAAGTGPTPNSSPASVPPWPASGTRSGRPTASSTRTARSGPEESDLSSHCTWKETSDRAKCEVLEQLGRGWHTIEDF